MLQKQSSVGYLKSTKINSQAKDKSFQFKRRIRRQYNPDDINIAKLFLAIREHRTGNPQLDKTNAIKELLTQVDNINDTDYNDNGNTPLHVAVSKRHLDIVKLLLSTRDINPKAKNNRGQTPLDIINEDLNSKSKTSLDQDIIQELQGASSLKRENTGENKPEVGSPKKLRISSIKKEEPEGTKIEEGDPRTYPASGLKHTLHGNIYQLKLLMLFLKRGLEKGYSFHLATEWDDAEKFDDLVFIHDDQNRGKSYHFLQAKHKQNEDNKKIGIGDLITEDKNGEFGLAKYFVSYLKIKNNQDFADGVLKDFIICTNIGFDLDQDTAQNAVKKLKIQTKGKNKGKEILVEMIEDNDVFFKDGGERYKLSYDKGNMALVVQQEFKVAVEETITKLETEIKKLQDKSDQDLKNKLKQIQKWEKEFKQIANSGLEDNIKEFFGKLVFAVNQPNEDKLATILQGKIGKEFEEKFNYAGNLSEDAYNKFQRVVQDWMKEKQGRFLSHGEVKEFFNNFESRVSTIVEIKQELTYLKDIVLEHIVTAKNNKQAQKDVWFDAENPSELFVGRTEELEKLHRALHDQGRIGVISQVSRISGLGGIGKTELAKKYICEYAKKHYNNVIWINAENDKTIADSFYRLASDKLGISIKNADREKKHVKSIIEEVFKSFSTEKSLFVFDNAEGLEYLKQILPLNNLMPNVKIPYILITSRSKEWGEKIRTIDLDTLSLDDSIKFIKKGLEIEDKSQNDQIGNLVKELQYFPLAIQQAIAHIKETQESHNFEGYLEKYRKKAKELINYKVFEWVNNGYTKTTYTVWEVTLDRIIEDKECGQLALDILNTMAYFAPENIIREMFLSLAGDSQTKLESAINLLVSYSMVNGEQKQSLSIHRLVQEVTRLKLREQQKEEEVLKKALELIKGSNIKKENISHVTSVLDYASRYNKLINNFDFTYGGRKYTPLNLLIEGNREEGVKNILDNLRSERYPSKLLKVVNTLDESGYSPLRFAIENSNLQIVKYLIENCADLDIKYEKGFTPLHFAALFGNLELARYLVDEEHVSFNVLDKYGKSPLHIASENGRIELVKYLVGEKKANINVLDNQHMAPLHFVDENGNLELAKYLIGNGADFYLRDKFGFTPLECAIDRGQDDIVKYLTEVKDRFGFTYLHKAAWDGNLDLFKLLINHNADLYRVDNDGYFPLHRAAENGKLEIVRYIIDKKLYNIDTVNNDKRTPLLLAAQNGHLEIVKFLVDKGADFFLPDKFGFTPLERAIDREHKDIVKYLTEVKDRFGFTYLHKAAWDGNLDLFKLLINHNADLYRVDNDGYFPLHRAAENGKLEIVRYIIDKKLYNIDTVNNDKRTPLLLAAQNGHLEIVKFLVDKGADFFLPDKFGFTPLERAIDREHKDIVKYLTEVKDRFGFTYLHKAAWDGNLDLFKLLINHNADLYRVDNDGYFPLHRAAENGKLEIVRYIIDKKLYNIDTVNNDKRTPLLLAAQNGHLEIVKFLVDKGADFFLPDKFGFTPLERAIDRGHEKVKEYLEEKGRFVADECLPSSSYRQKREAESNCLFTWEDVDKFNEEKDEKRDFSKIKIDSEKFVNYIKDLPEGKQSQLIQLASGVKVTGESQSLVNKLIGNQKVMNHLSKVGKISGMTMHGMMAKNILADFLNGNYQGVAINVGFIAGGQGFAKVAEAASLKGLKLSEEGKLLVSQSLKAASPFLARGTSAFVVYDLVNQIKAFKNGTEEALVGVVGDSIYLGVDAAEIGVEVAEAFGVLEGVSSVTGPIGVAIGAVVFVGTDIYMAVKRVDKIDEIVHFTGREKFIEGLRAFIGIEPEQYIEELMEKKQLNDQLVKQGLEYLKEHNNIQRYVFPTKRSVVDSCETFTREIFGMKGHFTVLEREKCKVKIQDDLDNVVFFDKEVSNVIYDRAKPDAPDGGELFCLPTGPIRPESGGENAYLCHDTIGLDYPANRTGNYTLIALGKGKDRATGFKYSPNIFLVDDGDKDFTGGDKDDLFILVGNKVTGRLDGGGGNNTLNLAEFSFGESLSIKPDSHKDDSSIFSPSNDIRIKNMNMIYGRKGKQDIVDCGCDVRYIDGQGGLSNNTPDNITIPYCYRPSEKKVIVRPSTEINNLDQSSNGNFDYIILPDKGKANINIEPDFSLTRQRKHNFLFNYTLFDLASIDIKNIRDINHWHAGYRNMTHTIRNVTFSFLSTLSKGKSINEKFNITISDIPANASYILSDNTEIKIGKNNLYAMHSTDKTIDEIVENYPTIADHLRMSLFISTNNETVVMGHGNHDIINNNFLQKSHLIGSGGENVYVITSGHEILDIENLPIPEVIIYDDFNKRNSLKDTLDLRQLVRQVNGDLSIEPISKIIEDRNDLLIKLSISAIALKQDVITVRLKDAFVNNWYKELQVILNNAPMKISSELELKPLPLIFDKDKEIIIVTSQDVEEKSELIISKEAGQYTFLSSRYDLMITNVFSADMETNKFCTICLKDFYKQPKMETLSVRFNDTEILLSNEIDKINNADSISDKLNMNGYVSSIVKLQESSAPLEAASSNHPIRHKRHKDHSRYEDGMHLIRHRNHRVQKHNINYQEDMHYSIDQLEIATSSGAKPSSWINNLFSWVKSSIGGLLGSRAALPGKTFTQSSISQISAPIDVNGTIMLLDLLIRKVTGQKYISTVDQSISPLEAKGYALSITKGFEKVVEQTAKDSKVSVHRLNIDFVGIQKEVTGKIMSGKFNEISGILKSYVEKACPGEESGKLSPKKFDKFMLEFNSRLNVVL